MPLRYAAAREDPFSGVTLRLRVLVTAAVFVSFVISSLARYPIPGPNEPHYLCKAKHYWDPQWCERDFFLTSSNAHLVFFQTFGLLTRWFSLDTTAFIGRMVGLLIFAAGWTLLVHTLVPARWPPLWAAWIFLTIADFAGNLSGEWLIGGIEAKVIAYGLLFAAMACCVVGISQRRGRVLLVAGILSGIAISFHPVAGIWGTACAVFASLIIFLFGERPSARPATAPTFRWWIAAAIGSAAILAVPGIVAGVRATEGSSLEADYIQVYYRLAHHLDPLHFAKEAWIIYAAMAAAWLVGRWFMARRSTESWFFWFVVGSSLIAIGGVVVGWRHGPPENIKNYSFPWLIDVPLRWKLLKLYPFRLVDAMLPIAVAITGAGLLRRWCEFVCGRPRVARRVGVGLIWLVCGIPALVTVLHPADDARPTFSAEELVDWRDVCRWTLDHTPEDSLILTPVQESWAFKWYAQRAEFVSFKDCPQDGPGILEWNNRLLYLHNWSESSLPLGYSPGAVGLLRDRGITYIIARRLGPFTFEPVYQNDTFRVYRVAP
ncbi:MAG TPA: DUF6798 domain-containing protein [Planctomycetaceae bacterium]|nr:DUF6798 domain-containing protein [Planctomycetaceae bacterium]